MEWLRVLQDFSQKKQPICQVQILKVSGSSPRDAGTRMFVSADGLEWGTIGGGKLEHQAIDIAKKVLVQGQPLLEKIALGAQAGQCCGGSVELWFEPFGVGPVLFLFGAGHVAQALVQVLEGTEVRVICYDSRSEWISKLSTEAYCEEPLGALDEIEDEVRRRSSQLKTYAIVMTHDHALDEALIEKLADMSFSYLGLIGSRGKWERFKQRYRLRNLPIEKFEKVHCPIGIDLPGKSPKEVAISIAAELLK